MPKATSGGASNGWEQQEAEAQAPVAQTAAPAPAETPDTVEAETPAVVETPVEAPAVTAFDVTAMTKAQLQDHADSLGLPTDGTKSDLAARIAGVVEQEEPAQDASEAQP